MNCIKRTCIIFFLLLSVVNSYAFKRCDLHFFFTAEAVSGKDSNSIAIKKFRRSYKTGAFTITLQDNAKRVLENQAVWGYENCGSIYRNFNYDFLKVEQMGSLIIYSRKSKGFRGRQITSYYFSKTLDGPIFLLDKSNIAEQFKSNPCFLSKVIKRFNGQNEYSTWDWKSASFVIVGLLKECQ